MKRRSTVPLKRTSVSGGKILMMMATGYEHEALISHPTPAQASITRPETNQVPLNTATITDQTSSSSSSALEVCASSEPYGEIWHTDREQSQH